MWKSELGGVGSRTQGVFCKNIPFLASFKKIQVLQMQAQ
jgi:hypothetical protein